jgi:hypothetical protein
LQLHIILVPRLVTTLMLPLLRLPLLLNMLLLLPLDRADMIVESILRPNPEI